MNKENDMEKKNKKGSLADRIPHQVWLLISFAAAMALWTLLSVIPATSRAFPNVFKVLGSIKTMIDRGVLWNDISSSLISVVSGYALGFVIALPVAILMAWYKPVRYIIEPWIQFIRNIPPLAYVPLIVIAAGVGRKPQIIDITIACFLIMCVTIYQGVINVDETLIKAARVLGATDKDIFIRRHRSGYPAVHPDGDPTRRVRCADDADCRRIHRRHGRSGHAHPQPEQLV